MKLFSQPMTNFTSPERARIEVKFHILPTSDVQAVRECMMGVMTRHPLALPEPKPVVILKGMPTWGSNPRNGTEQRPESASMLLTRSAHGGADVTQTDLVVAARVWVDPAKIFSAQYPIREELHEVLQARGHLAFFRTSIARTKRLSALGYPAMTGEKTEAEEEDDSKERKDELDDEMAQMTTVV